MSKTEIYTRKSFKKIKNVATTSLHSLCLITKYSVIPLEAAAEKCYVKLAVW